jgi:hypothetical protein
VNALLRFYYQIDPTELSDEAWTELFNEYLFVKQLEHKNEKAILKGTLIEVLNEMYKNE